MNAIFAHRLRAAWSGAILSASCFLLGIPARAWQADLGDGNFQNPVLFADYSDPDVIRVDSKFYMVSSSFHFMPGIPVLESSDLVNWKIISHVYQKFEFADAYNLNHSNRYGGGCWAPAIRYHDHRYWVFFPTPQEGIFMSTAKSPTGPWSPVVCVKQVAGWEDPCPFWDDGQAYLVHSVLGAGPLILHRMSPDGTQLLDDGVTIVNDRTNLPTLEGPKFYKMRGYYYIFAPAGGVGNGWQVVLRARNIFGPYESKKVLVQGNTAINGPHQGAYVETPDAQPWFLHFQSRGAYGRVFWLEPVQWHDNWPVIGQGVPGQDFGEPVLQWKKPDVPAATIQIPHESDEFNTAALGLQWQWNHNPDDSHWSLTERSGHLRLHATSASTLVEARNTLTQMLSDRAQSFITSLDVSGMTPGQISGLCLFQNPPAWIGVNQTEGRRHLCVTFDSKQLPGPEISGSQVYLQAAVTNGLGVFAFSTEGKTFHPIGEPFALHFSWWKGVRAGLFTYNTTSATNQPLGHADFDWFHVADACSK